jgi:hypothetical protein
VTENALAGFSGTGYIVWRGQDDFRADENSPPAGIKSYDFVVTQAGTYEFTARVQARVGNGDAAGDKDNDAWMRFTSGTATAGVAGDAGRWTKFFVGGDDESWKGYSSGEQYDPTLFTEIKRDLPVGTHRILIGGRSARFAIDTVGLTLTNANGEAGTPPPTPAPASPAAPEPVAQPTAPGTPAAPTTAACTATGDTLGSAAAQYANSCANIPRVDCDQISGGVWQCSSQVIGAAAPGQVAATPAPSAPAPTTPEPTEQPVNNGTA